MFALRTALCLIAVVAWSAVAGAAPVPVKADFSKTELPIPKDALVVVHVNGVGTVRDRFGKFIETALPAKAAQFKKDFDAALADAVNGRDLAALRPDSRFYVALFAFDGEGAIPVAGVLPTDLKSFRDKLLTADERKTFDPGKGGIATVEIDGRELFVVELAKAGYIVVSPHKETAALFTKKFDPLTGAAIGEPVVGAVLGSDLSVYVNLNAVNDKYGDQIRAFRGLFNNILGMGGMGVIPGLDPAQLDAAKVMFAGVFQAVEDGNGFGLGIEFRPDALALRAEMSFRPDTDSSRFLGTENTTALEALKDLPRGHAFYTAGKFGPSVTKSMQSLNREFGVSNDDKASELVAAYANLLAEASSEGTITVGSGLNRGLQVLTPKDPAKLVEAYAKALKAVPKEARYQNVPMKEKPALKEADQTHAGFKLHRATMRLDFEAAVADLPDENIRKATIESMKSMMDETMTYWFGTDGKRYVTINAKDWDGAKKMLDEYLAGKEKIGSDAAFQAARSNLPAEATQILAAEVSRSLTGLGGYMKQLMEAMPGFPGGDIPELKPVKDQAPAYIGVAVVLKSGSAGFAAVAPAAAVKAAYAILKPVIEKDQ